MELTSLGDSLPGSEKSAQCRFVKHRPFRGLFEAVDDIRDVGVGRFEPEFAESVVGTAETSFRRGGIALEQVHLSAEHVDFEKSLRDAEFFDHRSRRGEHAPRRIRAAAQRFEHALAGEGDCLDRRSALGDAKQATLSMVAPGIAEALIATAMGLFAAIPAVMAYNRFSTQAAKLETAYINLMEEFTSILHRQSMNEND